MGMHRNRVSPETAEELQERHYSELCRALSEGRIRVYGLSDPRLLPCSLMESQALNEVWRSVTLGYGSWDQAEEHAAVTTSRDLPGQVPTHEIPPGFEFADREPADVQIDGGTVSCASPTSSWIHGPWSQLRVNIVSS